MFDNVVYLNRDSDLQRKSDMEAQLFEHGVTATRFAAIEDSLQSFVHEPLNELRMSFAQASCLISHLEIIRNYGSTELLVFEDDSDLSPSKYWGTTFDDIVNHIDPSIGIVQMYVYPTYTPVLPRWWRPGTFGTGAYFIRPWYAKHLIEKGYKEGKWEVKAFESKYSQSLADSVLYSETPTVSLTLFSARATPSTILPEARYIETAAQFGKCWSKGLNNIDDIKASLAKFKC